MGRKEILEKIDCSNRSQAVDMAKEKLRWYTLEASEEEFDVEAVDALVELIRELEPGEANGPEEEEIRLADNEEKEMTEFGKKTTSKTVTRGVLIGQFIYRRRIAVGTVACLLLAVIILGNSLIDATAWEKGEFFHWLKKDSGGHTMITSPDDLELDIGEIEYYSKLADVPEKYKQYIVTPEEIAELEDFELEEINIYDMRSIQRIGEVFTSGNGTSIEMGVVVYDEKVIVVRDTYDDLEFQYTDYKENYEFDIYTKKNIYGEEEYTVFIYEGNRKIFVTGKMELAELEIIIETYADWILNM